MNLLYNSDNQVANYVKKIDWKKVAVTAGAIGVGIVLTVATGGLGAPVAMAIGGAASGVIISGYDAYSTGQRGWALAGSTLKGAGLGAITGFVGGQFIGAGANVAANVTQNITNQTVRHVAKAGVEAGVETAIDTGISLATGNPISLKNVATDYGLNLITNGSGSVSSKKSAKADVNTNKPKGGDVPVTKSRQSSTPVQQLALPGPKNRPLALPAPEPVLALPAPKSTPKTDFYVSPSGDAIPATSPYAYLQDSKYVGEGKNYTAAQKRAIIEENMARNGGVVRSDGTGQVLSKPQKSQKGVTPDPNEWQIDHIVPKSKGGSNSYGNAQVLSRYENRMKSDHYVGGN
ncbi:TPA: HNH endonuclease domain-containing protein [Streptococcus suis]